MQPFLFALILAVVILVVNLPEQSQWSAPVQLMERETTAQFLLR